MGIMERFRHQKKETSVEPQMQHANPFIHFFLEHEQGGDSAYLAAIDTLGELRKTASSIDEFQEIILEDVIFTSLNATYYEHLFNSLRENPEYLIQLIDRFSEDTDSRDNEIAQQGNDHFNYILNGGVCPGCKSCAHHGDVSELIGYWQDSDLDFFITLYVGMQTIQYALDQILYDLLPNDHSLLPELTPHAVLEFRQFVYKYAEDLLNN